MLAAGIKEYLYIWQLPLLALLGFGWLMLGGYFLSKGLRKNGASKKVTFGVCILATLFMSTLAGIVTVIVYKAGMKFSRYPISIPGLIGALIAYAGLFVLMVHTWQKKMTFAQTFNSTWQAIVAIVLLAAVILTPTGIISWNQRQKEIAISRKVISTQKTLLDIYKALQAYGPDRPPKNLEILVEAKQLDPEQLKSPINSGRKVGFIYAPTDIRILGNNTNIGQTVVAADYLDTFGTFRVVLYADGITSQVGEKTFQDIISMPCNKAFLEAVKKSEGGDSKKEYE